ncbi:hypothetical protein [Falsihalocynthiibacter arcticus]|uniref:Uncharacterized protein n=1 Tax=Falsihalocynthiibacter arcticus TaxID=1579316 RepID=A0A126V2K3_9RHOB|nr:hypothetical protein [Falsihalocynthiibacter arcticus]AML52510.1 hypothetical protein RC74_15625 [Falsihalocynthiibacter arcticus]
MFNKTTLSALALAVALPFAGAANAGNDQLAKIAGVEAGVYTTAELIQIDQARKTQDVEKLNFYLLGENRVSRADYTGNVSGGVAELAAIEGVSTNGYTASTLIELSVAENENDLEKVAFIKARAAGEISELAPNAVSPGKRQLAAVLGLDPASYTTAELIEIADW